MLSRYGRLRKELLKSTAIAVLLSNAPAAYAAQPVVLESNAVTRTQSLNTSTTTNDDPISNKNQQGMAQLAPSADKNNPYGYANDWLTQNRFGGY